MAGKFVMTEENSEVVESIFNLINSKEADETRFRRCFTLANIICGEYTNITRPDKPSVYGYFREKGIKKALKIGPEIDENMLESKLTSAGLVHGEHFFCYSKDYIQFANKYMVAQPEEETLDLEENMDLEEKRDVEDPVDVSEEEGNLSGITNPKEPAPPIKVPEKKKARIPKIVPTVVTAENKKSCLFRTVQPIPHLVQAIPEQYDFSPKEIADLSVSCGGVALNGVVTENHPLYGIPLVCDKHKARKYFHIYWRQTCPQDFVFTKLPNFARLCIQGKGGRPQLEEGKVQSNAATVNRSREKKQKKEAKLLTSYGQVLQEKNDLSSLCNNQQLLNGALQEDYQNLQQQYQQLYSHAQKLAEDKDSLLATLTEKDQEIFDLQAEVAQLRAQVHLGL